MPTVAALTERADQFRRQEVAKSLRRLDLSPGQEEQIEALTKALVKQILHERRSA